MTNVTRRLFRHVSIIDTCPQNPLCHPDNMTHVTHAHAALLDPKISSSDRQVASAPSSCLRRILIMTRAHTNLTLPRRPMATHGSNLLWNPKTLAAPNSARNSHTYTTTHIHTDRRLETPHSSLQRYLTHHSRVACRDIRSQVPSAPRDVPHRAQYFQSRSTKH